MKQLVTNPSNIVFATCRCLDTASTLQSLKNESHALHILQLDVRDEASISIAVRIVQEILGDRGLDYLINNAGQMVGSSIHLPVICSMADDLQHGADKFAPFSSMMVADLNEDFLVNVVGPALVSRAFLPLCEKSFRKVVVNISSAAGSFSRKDFGALGAAYCVSKAALNMLVSSRNI